MPFQKTHRQALFALTTSLACVGTASAAAFQLKEQVPQGKVGPSPGPSARRVTPLSSRTTRPP
jgi:hypothetical protein